MSQTLGLTECVCLSKVYRSKQPASPLLLPEMMYDLVLLLPAFPHILIVGLRLTDERVAAAAAGAAESRKHRAGITVAWHVAELLEATPPEKTADQHSGLSPLMRFACTAERNDQVPAEVGAASSLHYCTSTCVDTRF